MVAPEAYLEEFSSQSEFGELEDQELHLGTVGVSIQLGSTHQNGPLTPKFHATFELCSRVAAHVHCETITEAVKPVLTMRPAVLKRRRGEHRRLGLDLVPQS